MVQYQEYPPCPALSPYLACLWTCRVAPAGTVASHRVLPDNCIDILWQDTDPHGGVAGMMSSAITVPFGQPVRTIAVRFKPGAAARFFRHPLHELTDLHPSLVDLWGRDLAGRFADTLWAHPISDADALHAIERLLLRQLRQSDYRAGLAERAVDVIQACHGAIRIASLADALGVTRQHLASQFRVRVGLGAKQFARVCRFQHASERIRGAQAQQLDWAALALELGYYDQPHMIHEFRDLSGSTPQSFARG